MKTTSTYGASLLSVMGDDLTVVNAARVSFDKESALVFRCDLCENDRAECGKFGECSGGAEVLSYADRRLISYLAEHSHWTPFAHPQLSFRVSAPIFVARQLQKHQVGLAWNEVSRRYVDSEPVIYVPETWRKRADNVKQGSSDEAVTDFNFLVGHCNVRALFEYDELLLAGVCPEMARMVLPQSMMTEWIWTGSLAAFARVCNQRLDPHAQRECRPVAEDIAKALEDNFPVSWEALRNGTD